MIYSRNHPWKLLLSTLFSKMVADTKGRRSRGCRTDRDNNFMLTAATIKELFIWERRKVEESIVLQIMSNMKGSSDKTLCRDVGCINSLMEICMRESSSPTSVAERANTFLVMVQMA